MKHTQHVADFVSERQKAEAVLVRCAHCGIPGPKEQLERHRRLDHGGKPDPKPYVLMLPGRIGLVLERIAEIDRKRRAVTPRTPAAMAETALDQWLEGRRPWGMRRTSFAGTSDWGEER